MAVYLVYPLLLFLLFYGSKLLKRGEWNSNYLSFEQTKAFLGFCSVLIVFHHISQKTCDHYLDQFSVELRPGLELFVFVGYMCVAMFFFCSGYGMYISSQKVDSFFKHYFKKRILPLVIPTVFMWLIFFFIEKYRGMTIKPPVWINVYDYIWFVPSLIYMYIVFYLSFRLVKTKLYSFSLLWVCVIAYFVFCWFFSPGTWWYNNQFMFAIGAGVAAHVESFTAWNRHHYQGKIVLSLVITLIGFFAAAYYEEITAMLGMPYSENVYTYVKITGQVISSLTFVYLMLLIGMKIKIGNKALAFLSGFTLELYLVHPLFVHLFSFAFVQNDSTPVFYIHNQILYIAAVIIPAVPLAYVLHKVVAKCLK